MSLDLRNITDKLTMLQDDFGEEEEVTEADNSEAPVEPEPPAEPEEEIEEEPDAGTTDLPKEEPKPAEPQDCEYTFFGDCYAFTIWSLVLKILNVFTFFICITMNLSS